MKCKSCGKKIHKSAAFCQHCGHIVAAPDTSTPNTEEVSPPLKKKKTGKLIALLAVLILLAAGVFSLFHFGLVGSPIKHLEQQVENGDFAAAHTLYQDKIQGDAIREQEAADYFNSYLYGLKVQVQEGKLSVEDAKNAAQQMQNMYPSYDYKAFSDWLKQMAQSQASFEQGEAFFQEKSYDKAIAAYEQVLEEDSHYATATQRLAESRDFYKAALILEAEALLEAGDLEGAILKLEEGLVLLGETSGLTDLMEDYKSGEAKTSKEAALEEAEAYIKADNYPAALKLLRKEAEERGDGSLDALISTYDKELREKTLEKAKEAAAEGDYPKAVGVIKMAIAHIEDKTELNQLMRVYEANYPVSLDKLENRLEKASFESTVYDVEGNERKSVLRLNGTGTSGTPLATAQFTVGEFSSLSGTLVAHGDFGQIEGEEASGDSQKIEAQLVVLADGKELYTSPIISREAVPVAFSLDLEGISSITLELRRLDRTPMEAPLMDVIVADAFVSRVPLTQGDTTAATEPADKTAEEVGAEEENNK